MRKNFENKLMLEYQEFFDLKQTFEEKWNLDPLKKIIEDYFEKEKAIEEEKKEMLDVNEKL